MLTIDRWFQYKNLPTTEIVMEELLSVKKVLLISGEKFLLLLRLHYGSSQTQMDSFQHPPNAYTRHWLREENPIK